MNSLGSGFLLALGYLGRLIRSLLYASKSDMFLVYVRYLLASFLNGAAISYFIFGKSYK